MEKQKGIKTLVQLSIASYYKQLSDIKMKVYKIETSFVRSEGPQALANKTGISFMI